MPGLVDVYLFLYENCERRLRAASLAPSWIIEESLLSVCGIKMAPVDNSPSSNASHAIGAMTDASDVILAPAMHLHKVLGYLQRHQTKSIVCE